MSELSYESPLAGAAAPEGLAVSLREIANKRRATDALPPLPDAHQQESGAAPRRHTTSRARVTLADVIAGKTPLAWFESVAIVQGLCETVLARGPADDLRIPELKHIVVTGDGSVTLLADGPGGHSRLTPSACRCWV
jgi:hypothetical protein